MRFIGSFLGALVVVGILLTIGVRFFDAFKPETGALVLHEVDLLSASDQRELAGVLGGGPRGASLPPLADIPPLELGRSVQGFVQLELSVTASGGVSDARVIGSTLPVSYGQRAMDMVRDRRYEPDVVDGVAVASRRLEIVEFRMKQPTPGAQ